jgi:hypothetical protein
MCCVHHLIMKSNLTLIIGHGGELQYCNRCDSVILLAVSEIVLHPNANE